jgi:hypothetical protein
MQEIADGCSSLDVFLASKVGSQDPKTSPSDNVILSAAKALRLPLSHFARTENLVVRQCHSERSEGSAVIVEDSRATTTAPDPRPLKGFPAVAIELFIAKTENLTSGNVILSAAKDLRLS